MHSNVRLYLVLLAIVIVITCSAAVALTQQQQSTQPGPAPSEVTPPQTPSETPVTGEQGYTRQNQNDSNTAPPIRAEAYAESHVISWGSLIFGFLIGGAIGFLLGRRETPAVEVRRDRAA